MSGTDILALLKDGGYGLAAIAFIIAGVLWRRCNALQDARLADKDKAHEVIMQFATKSIEADKDATHALTALTDAIKSRPNV